MPNRNSLRALAGTLALIAVTGCVALPPNSKPSPQDPWERFNRTVYKVNDVLDRAIAKPVAKGYVNVVPQPVRTGVGNFFANLNTPTVMINDALQWKLTAAANDLARFLINSTFGIGGLLDPASTAGLDRNDEDFGQTLGKWGVHAGPFLEIPILGPSDLRDAPARVVDTYTNPQQYIHNLPTRYGLYGLRVIHTRAELLSLDETLRNVYDPYAFVRDAYLQRRAYLVSDGKAAPEEEPLLDPDTNESDAQRTPAKAPPPGAQPAPPSPEPNRTP